MRDLESEDENDPREMSMPASLKDDDFIIEEKFFSLGKKYIIKNSERKQVAYCSRKSMQLREDIRIFTDETEEKELFRIEQENVMNFTGKFKVFEGGTDKIIGHLKREGVRSVINDEWTILNPEKERIGRAVTDSLVKEAVRIKKLKRLPHRYKIYHDGERVGIYKQRFLSMKKAYRLQVTGDPEFTLDRRLLISLAICLDAIEEIFRNLKKRKVF